MPKTPALFAENVFENIWQFSSAALTASAEATGREARRVADGRRAKTWWEPTTDGGGADHYIRVDLGAGVTRAPDTIVLDRGHNLHGKTIHIEGGDDGAAWPTTTSRTVPASTVIGGNPESATTFSATEEGCHYNVFAALTARRWWRIRIPYAAAYIPKVTGLMLGARAQLLGYSAIFDDDAGDRKMRTEESDAGYLATGTIYHWRTLELDLKLIGDTEYDGALRGLRRALFEQGGQCFAVMDYETRPERGGVFQLDGKSWAFMKKTVYRSGRVKLRESGHRTPG